MREPKPQIIWREPRFGVGYVDFPVRLKGEDVGTHHQPVVFGGQTPTSLEATKNAYYALLAEGAIH